MLTPFTLLLKACLISFNAVQVKGYKPYWKDFWGVVRVMTYSSYVLLFCQAAFIQYIDITMRQAGPNSTKSLHLKRANL